MRENTRRFRRLQRAGVIRFNRGPERGLVRASAIEIRFIQYGRKVYEETVANWYLPKGRAGAKGWTRSGSL